LIPLAAADTVYCAASQVSASAQVFSRGTSEQAASVEETTASLEQMNASIRQNAANSRQMEQEAFLRLDWLILRHWCLIVEATYLCRVPVSEPARARFMLLMVQYFQTLMI